MVFASHAFLLFLVVLLLAYWIAGRSRGLAGKVVLTVGSLFFYAYWLPAHLLILLGSIAFNNVVGRAIMRGRYARELVTLGVIANLVLLGYYKYAAFFVASLNSLLATKLPLPAIVLPIGISFFTFQQISLLIDAYKGRIEQLRFWDHLLFISLFPHLIAGPIVRQSDLLPQIRAKTDWSLRAENVAAGIGLFSFGLFKKAFLIDLVVPKIDLLYRAADLKTEMGFVDSWVAAIGYGFQIYFDFSAYSDMAIGLAFIFGLRLPINFFSPYKAESIRAFWRRWHITLSLFLRDYVFIPLGGSRHGLPRTLLSLLLTMSIGGLWHGAAWSFVAWGFLHGVYLCVNHLWREALARWLPGARERVRALPLVRAPLYALSVVITFLAVNLAWALFRASNWDSALRLVAGMLGQNGLMHRADMTIAVANVFPIYFLICWALPNTMQIFRRTAAALHSEEYTMVRASPLTGRVAFGLSRPWAAATAVVFVVAWFALSNLSPFIYFQF
jgi:D-alanyl-lipoteichoic acid acyltransferase DltB (MBOAT superfamily)